MPRNLVLSWHEPRKCWKKFFNGKRYYLAKRKCRGKTDMEGYRTALAEWEGLKTTLGMASAFPVDHRVMDVVASGLALPMATDYSAIGSVSDFAKPAAIVATNVDELSKLWISRQRQRVEAGNISAKMYGQYRDKIEDFIAFTQKCIGQIVVTQIDARLLDIYRQYQLQLTRREDEHRISPHTAKKRLDAVKQFCRWLYQQERLERWPRNLDGDYAQITLPKPTPKAFTVDEVRKIFDAASQRTKLYIALALNAGYTQIDIATLEHKHIDFSAGVIRRRRHKTDVPQEHNLWPVTLELLKREAEPAGSRFLLLDENGKQLYRVYVKPDGKVSACDTIRLAFDRVMKKLGMEADERRFKCFRKTTSNELERRFPDYPHLASQFLAHGETATKRYYVARHFDTLFAKLADVGTLFNLSISDDARPTPCPD